MAEVVASLSLACNIVQVIQLSGKLLVMAKRVHNDGQIDQDLSKQTLHLGNLAGQLDTALKSTSAKTAGLGASEKELQAAARGCYTTARQLQEELSKLAPKPGRKGIRKAMSTAVITIKAQSRKSKLEGLEKSMQKWQAVIDSGLLVRICSAQQAHTLQQSAGFDKVDDSIQALVRQLASGTREVAVKVEQEAVAIRDHIDKHVLSAQEQARLNQLLASLRFQEMNSRKNAITDSYTGTFLWAYSTSPPDKLPHGIRWSPFSEWLKADGAEKKPLYWISGKPGSGKSTLMQFLVEDDRTREHLRPGTLVISHYFWAAGSDHQHSVEGVMRTLLYQVITAQPEMVQTLSSSVRGADDKTSCSDWSQLELHNGLFHCLRHCGRPVCIFIDGLDEISGHERPDVMDLIDDLCLIQDVRICISSRPERAFVAQYGARPMMRVQDLTQKDIMKVCTGTLEAFHDKFPKTWLIQDLEKRPLPTLVELLTKKAEGVFLWVILALKTVRRGVSNTDSWQDVMERLEALPSDLDELYKCMWHRIGEDRKLYENRGAILLRLLLEGSWNSIRTVLDLAFCRDPALQDSVFDSIPLERTSKWEPDTAALREACHDLTERLTLYCGDLVELRFDKNTNGGYGGYADDLEDVNHELLVARHTEVVFIHRTARDFLTETEAGLSILSVDPTPRVLYKMAEALSTMATRFLLDDLYAHSDSETFGLIHNAFSRLGLLLPELAALNGSHEPRVMSIARKYYEYFHEHRKHHFPDHLLPDTLGVFVRYFSTDQIQPMLGDVTHKGGPLCPRYLGYLLGETLTDHGYLHHRSTTTLRGQKLVSWLIRQGADPTGMMYMTPFGRLSRFVSSGIPWGRTPGRSDHGTQSIHVISPLIGLLRAAIYDSLLGKATVTPRAWYQGEVTFIQIISSLLVSPALSIDSLTGALSQQLLVLELGVSRKGELYCSIGNTSPGVVFRDAESGEERQAQFVVEVNASFLLRCYLDLSQSLTPPNVGSSGASLEALKQVSSTSPPTARLLMTSISRLVPQPLRSQNIAFGYLDEPLPLDVNSLLALLTLDGPPDSIGPRRGTLVDDICDMVAKNIGITTSIRDDLHMCQILKAYCFPTWPPPKRHHFPFPPSMYRDDGDDQAPGSDGIDAGYDSDEYYDQIRVPYYSKSHPDECGIWTFDPNEAGGDEADIGRDGDDKDQGGGGDVDDDAEAANKSTEYVRVQSGIFLETSYLGSPVRPPYHLRMPRRGSVVSTGTSSS